MIFLCLPHSSSPYHGLSVFFPSFLSAASPPQRPSKKLIKSESEKSVRQPVGLIFSDPTKIRKSEAISLDQKKKENQFRPIGKKVMEIRSIRENQKNQFE
jgi:hypothetical protein